MKNIITVLSLSLLFALSSCSQTVQDFVRKKQIEPVQIKKVSSAKRVLSNGMTVIHKQSDDVPIFKAVLYLPVGTSSGNCGVAGLSSIAVQMIREGGTKSYSPDELDRYLDSNVIQVESSQAEDFTSFSVTSLSGDLVSSLKVFKEIVRYPRFDNSRVELIKQLTADDILRRKDDPDTISTMTFNMAMYGEGTNWYDPLTKDKLKNISQDQIKNYHRFLMNPNGSYIVATSQLRDDDFFNQIEEHFGDLKSDETAKCESQKSKTTATQSKPTIYLVSKEFEQSSILIGQKSKSVKDTELYKMTLFNRVFGSGSFDSLLFREIRDKRGLAYGVSGGFSATKQRGMFYVNLGTKANEAINAVLAVKSVINDVQKNGFSLENVEGAITSNLQTFVFRFEDPFYSISRPALISLSGFPDSYDDNYQKALLELEKDNLQSFASKEILDEGFVISIVGKLNVDDIRKSDLAKDFTICEVDFNEIPRIRKCD